MDVVDKELNRAVAGNRVDPVVDKVIQLFLFPHSLSRLLAYNVPIVIFYERGEREKKRDLSSGCVTLAPAFGIQSTRTGTLCVTDVVN